MTQDPIPPVPRKLPQQERSMRMVNAILDGCKKVLEEHGEDALSVAVLEAVSGVSKGSIYQYYPSLDAVVGALFDREFETFIALSSDHFRQLPLDFSLAQFLQELNHVALQWHEKMRGLHAAYYAQYSLYYDAGKRFLEVYEYDAFASTFIYPRVIRYRPNLSSRRAAETAHLLLHLHSSLFFAALHYYPDRLREPQFQQQMISASLAFVDAADKSITTAPMDTATKA